MTKLFLATLISLFFCTIVQAQSLQGFTDLKSDESVEIRFIQTNESNEIYVIGDFKGNLKCDTIELFSEFNQSFLMKFDHRLNALRATSFTGQLNSLRVDLDNGFMVVGEFINSLEIGVEYSIDVVGKNSFIARWNSVDELHWVKIFDGVANLHSITTDTLGNIYGIGFGDGSLYGTEIISFKLDINGSEEWRKIDTLSGHSVIASGITIGEDIYFAGSIDDHSFLRRYDQDGNIKSNAGFYGQDIENPNRHGILGSIIYDMTYDLKGNIYSIGNFEGRVNDGIVDLYSPVTKSMFISKHSKSEELIWMKHYGSLYRNDFGYTINFDPITERIKFCGTYGGNWDPRLFTNKDKTEKDAFYVEMDSVGNLVSVLDFTGKGNKEAVSFASISNNSIVLACNYESEMKADFVNHMIYKETKGSKNAIIFKFQNCGSYVDTTATIYEGNSYIFGSQILTEEGQYTEVFQSKIGCDSTVVLNLLIEDVLKIEQNSGINYISIFPNPTSGIIEISFRDRFLGIVELLDLTGRIFKSWPITNKEEVNLELDVPTGIYIIRINNIDGNFNSFRLLKE